MRVPSLLRRRVLAEADRRRSRRRFRAEDLCRRGTRLAVQQLAFIQDPARWRVACCSRRAGKTHACAILLLDFALRHAESLCLYVTLTRLSGKRIVWKRLLKLNREYSLGGDPNRSELTLTLPNGSEIRVMGAKDEAECDKIRGIDPAPRLVVIDEAQAFRAHVQELVDDVLQPMLLETKGTMVLIGTPGPVRAGYFYEACRSADDAVLERLNVAANDNGGGTEWSVHQWTIADNPWIDDVDDELAALRRRKGWAPAHPTYQREYLGRWVTEHDSLVYKYDHQRNGYEDLPDVSGPDWRCLIVVDQGFHDADAGGRLWFRPKHPGIWLEECLYQTKATAQDLVAAVAAIWQPVKGRCIGVVWDFGGGGVKVAEDARRMGLPVEAAEKGPGSKLAGVELVNGALVHACLLTPLSGQAAADAMRVTWDPKARGVKFSEKYHTDIWDGVSYGLHKLVGVIPMDRPAELPVQPGAEEQLELERQRRIKARAAAASRDWVKRALG